MANVVIDASVFSEYVASHILDEEITCQFKEKSIHNYNIYLCSTKDGKKFTLTNGSIKLLEKSFNAKIEEKRNVLKIKIDKNEIARVKGLAKTLKILCNTNDCYVTPDFGISTGKGMVNPFVLRMYGRPIYKAKEDGWNEYINKSLEELNAKILIDKDLEKFMGTEKYVNLVSYFENNFRKRIDKDEKGKFDPIISIVVRRGKHENRIEVDVQNERIIFDGEDISEKWKGHPSLNSIFKAVIEGGKDIQELAESVKRIIGSKGEKMKKYYYGEGIIDVYLKGISKDDDTIILTRDVDLIKDIDAKLEGGDTSKIAKYI